MQSRQRETDNERQEKSFTIGQVAHITGVHAAQFAQSHPINLLACVPLSEARALLRGALDAQCTDVQQELLGLVNARLVALDQEIAELHHLRHEIACYHQTLEASHPNENEAFRTCSDMSCIALPKDTIRKEETR